MHFFLQHWERWFKDRQAAVPKMRQGQPRAQINSGHLRNGDNALNKFSPYYFQGVLSTCPCPCCLELNFEGTNGRLPNEGFTNKVQDRGQHCK